MIDQLTPNEYTICIDEAGRGPLAGPVTVGAVMALRNFRNKRAFKDSKLLTAKQRELLYEKIHEHQQKHHLVYGWGMGTTHEIDNQGIIRSLTIATGRAIFSLLKEFYQSKRREDLLQSGLKQDTAAVEQLDTYFAQTDITPRLVEKIITTQQSQLVISKLLIDGNHTFGLEYYLSVPIETMIKGDQKNPLISMASIVAKVERDRHMVQICDKLPAYNLSQHKGYGTYKHIKTIKQHGLSVVHRSTFCTRITTTVTETTIQLEEVQPPLYKDQTTNASK